MTLLKQPITNPTSQQLQAILADIHTNAHKRPVANRNLPLVNTSSHQLSEAHLADIDAQLHAAAASDRTRMLNNKSSTQAALKRSFAEAIMDWECNWDIDLALTLPRANQAFHCPVHLSKFLHGYFTAIDAVVFAGIPRRKRPKLTRFVVKEHTDGIGWHCHAIIASPPNTDIFELDALLRGQWFKRIGLHDNPKFNPDRFYFSSAHQDSYIGYTLKHAIDTNNCNLDLATGIIDIYNTSYQF